MAHQLRSSVVVGDVGTGVYSVEALEAELLDGLIDPLEPYREGRELWIPIGVGNTDYELSLRVGFRTEGELAQARQISAHICHKSPYARNALRNLANYVVGTGHTYQVRARADTSADRGLIVTAQRVVDAFVRRNQWPARQKETLRRLDRDGECFRRVFVTADGQLVVRFVEPWQVAAPAAAAEPRFAFGVETDEQDVETVLNYWIDGEPVPADQVQHLKRNVDANVRRGSPTFWVVARTLLSVSRVRGNMNRGSDLQTSIAYVRKADGASRSALESFTRAVETHRITESATGRTKSYQRHEPGRILTSDGSISYEFPWAHVSYDGYVRIIADNLREVAALLVLPEFMLTSDASNNNYASALVAEGPASRNFESEQADLALCDLELLERQLDVSGLLPEHWRELLEIEVGKPSVKTRDEQAEAQRDGVLLDRGVLSPQTMAARHGLDYEQERKNLDEHEAKHGPLVTAEPEPTSPASVPASSETLPQAGEGQQVEVAPAAVLNGAQVQAAAGIVAQVVAGQLPRDAGLGMLEVLFNLTATQAARIMGSAGTTIPTTPNPVPVAAGPIAQPPNADQLAREAQESRTVLDALWQRYPLGDR